MTDQLIYSTEDVLSLLDDLLADKGGSWWNEFYADRARPIPFFAASFSAGSYDLVYDSGCFHHLPPHRREVYVELIMRALTPHGRYGLVCFRPEGGSGLSDREVYERWNLGGGLGYSRERLAALWAGRLEIQELRQMRTPPGQAERFGEDFLWVLLAGQPEPA